MLSPDAETVTCDLCGASPVVAYATGAFDALPATVDLCERCTVGLVLDAVAWTASALDTAADLYDALDQRAN